MKASVCDLLLFHFLCSYSMFLDLIEQADELNGNVANDSPPLQVNATFMFWELGMDSQTLPCLLLIFAI